MPVAGIKVLTIGKPFTLPYEVIHVEDSAQILSTIAQFQPDVIVTSAFIPGRLNLAPFEIRKRWLNVDPNSTTEAICQAIENCYSYNIWTEHQYQKDNPLISVYTGTFNTGDYLKETYESLKGQTYSNWEWVVVDDHSSDGTWERLLEMANEDIRVRPFRSGKRLSKIGAVKDTATRLSRGVYLVELDHDDMLTDFALAEIRKAFDEDPAVGFVYSNCSNFFENGTFHRFTDDFWKNRYRDTEYHGKTWVECLQPDIYDRFGPHFAQQFGWFLTVGPNHVRAFRKKTFLELGGYNPSLLVADDWDLFARFFLHSKCKLIDKMLYLYRFKDNWANTTFVRNKAIQDHLALGHNRYAKEFDDLNRKRLGAAPPAPVGPLLEKPCFVVASRTEEDANKIRTKLKDQDLFVKVGAKSILEAYEEGRVHWKDRRRIIYVHDDVAWKDLGAFVEMVSNLPVGLHGPCGSQAPDALDRGPWWEAKPLAGAYVQTFKDGSPGKAVRFQNGKSEVTWLDGFCLVAIDQKWSWNVPTNPAVWHGYDWLASKRTKLSGGRCFTFDQAEEPFLSHEGYMRTEGLEEATQLLRALSRLPQEHRDFPKLQEYLAEIQMAAKGAVVEIGATDGASTWALLSGVIKNGGRVFSIGASSTSDSPWRHHPFWQSIGDPSESGKEERLPDKIDVLFINPERSRERILRALDTWIPRMKPGGCVFIRDTETYPEVKKAVEEFAPGHSLQANFRTGGSGLTVLRTPGDTSSVSFIVLEAAPTDLTLRCLKSVRSYAPGAEIVLVCNGSTPSTEATALADQVLRLDANLGFAAGCNAGAEKATKSTLCFLNNDAAFVDQTPGRLVSAMSEIHPIVAPFSNRAKPPQGDVERKNVPATDLYPDMVVGLCMMMPKNLFRTLGGFDSRLLTYEDDDLCLRARMLGMQCKVVGGTWVEHERHATFKALGLDPQAVMNRNRMLFHQKNPTIRVIVIAKNEEQSIPGFFTQFLPVTRDWCLLDTGSTDRTVDLAKKMGVRVESGPFGDFASARNLAIEKFREGADWIIMFDPDERLDAHTLSHLRELVHKTPYDIFLSPLHALYPDGRKREFVAKPFLFRNRPDIRWTFKVHEKLIGSKEQAMIRNAKIEHVIALHEDGRRQNASGLYDGLMRAEPYFTDPKFKEEILKAWPILDYDRMDDERIKKITLGPLISVVIPTYKRRGLCEKALSTALRQDYANVEIVIVGDNCPEMDVPFLGSHSRVRAYNLKSNHGSGGAVPRNHAIMASSGSLIAYLDDDNEWKPDHLSSVYEAMRQAGATFAFSSMEVNGKDLGFTEPKFQGIDTSCVIHRKDLVEKYGYWKDRIEGGYAHDWEFISRWMKGGEIWAATGKATLIYNAETSGQVEFLKAQTAKL